MSVPPFPRRAMLDRGEHGAIVYAGEGSWQRKTRGAWEPCDYADAQAWAARGGMIRYLPKTSRP